MEYVIAVIAALPSLAALAYTIYKDKRQDKSTLARAVGFLLLDRIKSNAREYIRRGSVTADEMESLEESYSIYHKLGGNGFADTMMAQCRILNIKGAAENEK